jgi:D-amino-acid dehydrogenase
MEVEMKVAVLGGGVIGMTTAYYLQQNGHEVVVYDRQDAVGMETSFANAGQISWGYVGPWASPGVPLKALFWLFERHAPLVLRPTADPALWRWLGAFLANGTNVVVDTGHGTLGWTMARGASYIAPSLVTRRAASRSTPQLELSAHATGAFC